MSSMMALGYNTSTCAAACQLIDPLFTQCLNVPKDNTTPENNGVGLEPDLDCLCPDLNVGNIRVELLNACVVCDQENLGDWALSKYQYYDLLCNTYNNVPAAPGTLKGGPDNAAGETEGGVEESFSQTCLSQLQGSSYAITFSESNFFSCDKWNLNSQLHAMSVFAEEQHTTVPGVATAVAASATGAMSGSSSGPASTSSAPSSSSSSASGSSGSSSMSVTSAPASPSAVGGGAMSTLAFPSSAAGASSRAASPSPVTTPVPGSGGAGSGSSSAGGAGSGAASPSAAVPGAAARSVSGRSMVGWVSFLAGSVLLRALL